MSTLAIDTYRAIQTLQSRGYSKDQAEGMVEILKQVDVSELATKGDIKDVLLRIETSKNDILRWVVPLILGLYAVLFFRLFGHI